MTPSRVITPVNDYNSCGLVMTIVGHTKFLDVSCCDSLQKGTDGLGFVGGAMLDGL